MRIKKELIALIVAILLSISILVMKKIMRIDKNRGNSYRSSLN